MNMKSSLLTLALVAGISCGASADSSRLKELMDASSSVSSISANVGSADLRSLLSHCESLEKLNKKSYDCKMLGKKQLIEAVKQGVSDFNEILSAEKEAQSKAEMNEKLKDIKVAVNKAQYFMEYLDICEKLKTVKANNPNSFNECKIDTVSDCEESDIATLKPIFEECIGSGNKSSGTGSIDFSDCGVPENQKKIWKAVADRNSRVVREEVDNYVSTNATNCKGISLVYMAASNNDTNMVYALVDTWGTSVNTTPSPICPAIKSLNQSIFKTILDNRGYGDSGIVRADCDGTGGNTLIYAIKNQAHSFLRQLIAKDGSVISVRDNEGRTAVHHAAMRQDSESLKALLFSTWRDYDSCITDDNGKTAYDYLDNNLKNDFASYLKCGD